VISSKQLNKQISSVSFRYIKAKLDAANRKFIYTHTTEGDRARHVCHKMINYCSHGQFHEMDPDTPNRTHPFDMVFRQSQKKKRQIFQNLMEKQMRQLFKRLDLRQHGRKMLDLLWKTVLPCFDNDLVSEEENVYGVLIDCLWKGHSLPCHELFVKFPTDQGLCCTFNMARADSLLNPNLDYVAEILTLQERDKNASFKSHQVLPQTWYDDNEPQSKQGVSNGLTLVLDSHSNVLATSSVTKYHYGIFGFVDGHNRYPRVKDGSFVIQPGHESFITISAVHISANSDIHSIDPNDRRCLFDDEWKLKMFQKYSRANCMFECQLDYSRAQMENRTGDIPSCIPWYYPPLSNDHAMCNPWEAEHFDTFMNSQLPSGQCDHCLPDCVDTTYTTGVTTAPFRECDDTNTGLNMLCNLDEPMFPSMWEEAVLAEYRHYNEEDNGSLPRYISEKFDNQRGVPNSIFSMSSDRDPHYDVYKRDIAIANFFFESATTVEFTKAATMSDITFVSQIGGLIGLFLGFSFVSIFEIAYWFTYRLGRNVFKKGKVMDRGGI